MTRSVPSIAGVGLVLFIKILCSARIVQRGVIIMATRKRIMGKALSLGNEYVLAAYYEHANTDDDLMSILSGLIEERFGSISSEGGMNNPWVVDLFQNKVIYSIGGRHYRIAFKRNKNNVTLGEGLPTEVKRITRWAPITNEKELIITI